MKLKKITVQYYNSQSDWKQLLDEKHVFEETKEFSALGLLYDYDGTLANALEDSGILEMELEAKKVVLERFMDCGGYPNHVTIENEIEELF